MIDDSEVLLISYPPGGFGNFIFHMLTEFADNTYKPKNQNFKFSSSGNSHDTIKYTNIYYNDPDSYTLNFPNTTKKVLVLCDNGNNDSYTKIRKFFPTAKIIRLVISPAIRPVIYQTCIKKAVRKNLIDNISTHVSQHWDNYTEAYAIRENFTLMYHNWNPIWGPNNNKNIINVDIESLVTDPVQTIINLITSINGSAIHLDKLVQLCNDWRVANKDYFELYYLWTKLNLALDHGDFIELPSDLDLHAQGYLNYCIENKYNVIIPVYDYRNWFQTTNDIKEMIQCLK